MNQRVGTVRQQQQGHKKLAGMPVSAGTQAKILLYITVPLNSILDEIVFFAKCTRDISVKTLARCRAPTSIVSGEICSYVVQMFYHKKMIKVITGFFFTPSFRHFVLTLHCDLSISSFFFIVEWRVCGNSSYFAYFAFLKFFCSGCFMFKMRPTLVIC